ncbi:hypothetical protein CEXT_511041 [Caerostris extrusa]|uniref:Uncharacterized protein n=1 Tax=Caerostris extrusa TaxID=172846 RepID=A0AAV4XIL2_CAEEX|nr:hypothetical protein CEXT_511041 [Caerostris extrusa]
MNVMFNGVLQHSSTAWKDAPRVSLRPSEGVVAPRPQTMRHFPQRGCRPPLFFFTASLFGSASVEIDTQILEILLSKAIQSKEHISKHRIDTDIIIETCQSIELIFCTLINS